MEVVIFLWCQVFLQSDSSRVEEFKTKADVILKAFGPR